MLQPCDCSLERSPHMLARGLHSAGFGFGRGAAEEILAGLNKPANLSFRGRGYRRDTIRYQTQTLGAHPHIQIAAPRAASPNSGSLLARRISASRAPRRAPAPSPPPRRVGTHIPDMRARRRRSHTPFYHMLGARRPSAVARSRARRRR